MCWNCGCMDPDDDHGNPDNITTETLKKAGRAGGPEYISKILDNMNTIYKDVVEGTPADTEMIS